MYFLSVLHADSFSKMHLKFFSSLLIPSYQLLSPLPLSLVLSLLLLLKAFAIQVHESASTTSDTTMISGTFRSTFGSASLLQHRHRTNSASKSRERRAMFQTFPELVSPWESCSSSALLLYIFFPFRHQESSRFVLCALSTKGFFCTSLFSSFSSFFHNIFSLRFF